MKKFFRNLGRGTVGHVAKKILALTLIAVMIAGVVCGIGLLAKQIKKDTKGVTTLWHVGGIDQNGQFTDSKNMLYSNAIDARGLTVTPDFDSTVKYKIFFYDEDDVYLDSTEDFTDQKTSCGILAPKCRIVITPKSKDVKEIKFWEKAKYSTQLKIEALKDQTLDTLVDNVFVADEGVKLFESHGAMLGKEMIYIDYTESEKSMGIKFTNVIECKPGDKLVVLYEMPISSAFDMWPHNREIYYGDSNGKFFASGYVGECVVEECGRFYRSELIVPEDAYYVRAVLPAPGDGYFIGYFE